MKPIFTSSPTFDVPACKVQRRSSDAIPVTKGWSLSPDSLAGRLATHIERTAWFVQTNLIHFV
jgi:hypothetical protein